LVYFTSDLHIGHNSIFKYRNRFKTSEEHHEYMISKIEELGKRDVLIVLGDFLFDSKKYEEHIKRINNCKCRIKVVMGNHDSLKLYKEPKLEVQLPLYSYKNIWVSHCPIHQDELRDKKGNIHGHLHLSKITIPEKVWTDVSEHFIDLPDERYFNVNIDVNDYEFVKLNTIKEHFKI